MARTHENAPGYGTGGASKNVRLGGERFEATPNPAPLQAQTVREAARGRWLEILTKWIDGRFLANRHGPCPGCNGVDRFRFDNRDGSGSFICSQGGGSPLAGDGFGLLQHVNGWGFRETLEAVADALGMAEGEAPAPRRQPHPQTPQRDDSAVKIAAARKTVEACRPVQAEALDYLRQRGITQPLPGCLLYHSALYHYPTGQHFPALVATVEDESGVIGCVRTYLDWQGRKAGVSDPRLTKGKIRGGAVRLTPPAETLWIAEGVEDALSITQMLGQAAWAVLGTAGFASTKLPAMVRRVVLAPDNDPAGQATIDKAARRLVDQGREVRIARPPEGRDWNDLLADYEERAGILEYDAFLDRPWSESMAARAAIGGVR